MPGYDQPPQGGYRHPYGQPDPRLQGYGQPQGYDRPQRYDRPQAAAGAAGQHVYMPNPAISRRADAALLADPMLAEEATHPTAGRRRSRMVMRQGREDANLPSKEPASLQEKAEAAKQQVLSEASADRQQVEPLIPEAPAFQTASLQEKAEAARQQVLSEASADRQQVEPLIPEAPAFQTASLQEKAEAARQQVLSEASADRQQVEPLIPEAPAFQTASLQEKAEAARQQVLSEATADRQQVEPLPEAIFAGLNLSEFIPEEEDEEPEQEDCMDTSRMPIPAPVSTLDIPKTKRGNRWLALLAVLMLLAAVGSFLWLSGTGEKLYRGVTGLIQQVTSPTVETGPMNVSPEAAALPAVLTITLTTGEEAADLQLLDDNGHPFEAEVTRTPAEGGVLWTCRILFQEPYEGFIRANLLVDGQWKLAQASRHVQVN